MLRKRIIPLLLIDNNKLVKTVSFKNPSYVGDPINTVKIFNEKKIDELVILDISSRKKGKINFQLIEEIAGECRMPFSYGGGIDDEEQVEKLFSIGVEKIILNYSVFNDISIIKKFSKKYGSQSIVLSINLMPNLFGQYKVYNWINRKITNINLSTFLENCIDQGVGEIILTFVDKEGTLKGLDYEIFNKLNLNVDVPIILNGGINNHENIKILFKRCNIEAIAVGSFFVYYGPHKAVLISYPSEEEKRDILE